MTDWALLTNDGGVAHYFRINAEGDYEILSVGDTTATIETNKAMYNHNDGYTPSRELRRVASIDPILYTKWLNEGFDMYDPNNAAELRRRLDSSEYLYLRTAPGRLGKGAGRHV